MMNMPLNNAGGERVLSFYLGERLYGIRAAEVAEILDRRELTVIPNGPKFLLGIFPVRGEIVAVIDLKAQFGINAGTNLEHKLVVLQQRQGEIQFAFSTDSILGLTHIQDAETTAVTADPLISANALLSGSVIEILNTSVLVSTIKQP